MNMGNGFSFNGMDDLMAFANQMANQAKASGNKNTTFVFRRG